MTAIYPCGPAEFFRRLILGHDIFEGRYIELRQIERGKVTPLFHQSDNGRGFLDHIADNCKTQPPQSHWYYGVHPRDRAEGTSEAVNVVTCFHADLDYKKLSHEAWLDKLRALPLKVTVVVFSGNGLHAYWLLKEPELLETEGERNQFLRVQAGLQAHLGADPTHDLARVLRIPGSANWKTTPPAHTQILFSDFERTHTISRFDDFLETLPEPPRTSAPERDPPDREIEEGGRNAALTSLAGAMRRKGMDLEAIRAALVVTNKTRCKPPLPDFEVGAVARSVCRYEPGETKTTGPRPLFRARLLSEVPREEVTFLWYPYIPSAKLTLLEGDPGIGKSYLIAAIAAAITTGGGMPKFAGPKGKVLVLTAEDGAGDTVRPRCEDLGADLSKVTIVSTPVSLDPKACVELDSLIAEFEPSLVVLDPITSFLAEQLDINRSNEVRRWMQRLGKIATDRRTAIVLIRHLAKYTGKSKGVNKLYRGLGSIDFTACARSLLAVVESDDHAPLKTIYHVKSNLAPRGPSVKYFLEEDGSFRWVWGPGDLYGEAED